MTQPTIQIYDLMACNVYWDFDTPGLGKEQHKFLVAFYPTEGASIPELVDSIVATGPDGYRQEIANQKFTGLNKNGHIFDRTTNSYWYMLNLDTGFMKAGEYTVTVTGKDGSTCSVSRVQKDGPSQTLVSAYQTHRERIFKSFSPGQGDRLELNSSEKDVEIKWTPLREWAGTDAYYIFRLSQGANIKQFDTQNLHWWDNIFLQRFADPNAGKNRDRVTVASELQPGKPYVYFTEITDSNAMGQTNICIFQPHQSFTA